jgi:hypothetical protein
MLVCLGCWSACTAYEAPRDLRLTFIVDEDDGVALAQVPLEVDGAVVAHSDQHGRATATLPLRSSHVRVSVLCPDGYSSPEPRSVPVSQHGRQPPLELHLRCRPSQRSVLVVVRAPLGAGLPVLADGDPIGQLDALGTLHARIERPAGSRLRLTLDTSADPRLSPQHPVREVELADRDELAVFDQQFTLPAPPRRSRARAPERPPPKHIPYAIGGVRY